MFASRRNPAVEPSQDHVLAIYNDDYASEYNMFYLHPWEKKHALNMRNIEGILGTIATPSPVWLDLCCGQAWHFTKVADAVEKVGVDISKSQLERASKQNPAATFIEHDILSVPLPNAAFDLVSCFWGAYCYLDSNAAIAELIHRAIAWTCPGGSIYFEVLLPLDLMSFNASHYAAETGFQVIPRNDDCSAWAYQDGGGRHDMTSPPLTLFTDLLSPHFSAVEAVHDDGFMTHLIARRKHGP